MDLLKPSYASGYAKNASQSAHPNLWDGLVGAWMPSLGVTGRTLRDVSGESNLESKNTADHIEFEISNKKTVCNLADYAYAEGGDLSKKFQGGYSISINLWRRSTLRRIPFAQWGNGGTGYASWLLQVNTSDQFEFYNYNGVALSGITAPAMSLQEWQNVTVTWDGSTTGTNAHIYYDGIVVASGTMSIIPQVSTQYPIQYGRANRSNEHWWGKIGDTLAYNRALSPSEIKQLYVDSLAPFRTKKRTVVRVPAAIPAATKVGSIKKPTTIIKPSYQAGYARNASESENPNLWDGLEMAYVPMGSTRLKDLSGNNRDPISTTGNLSTGIIKGVRSYDKRYPDTYMGYGVNSLVYDGSSGVDLGNTGFFRSAGEPMSYFFHSGSKPTTFSGALTTCWGGISAGNIWYVSLYSFTSMTINYDPTGSGAVLNVGNVAFNMPHTGGFVYNGSNLRAYIDGLQAGQSGHIPNAAINKDQTSIGYNAFNNDTFHYGGIGSIYIWSRALTASEYKKLHRDPLAPFRRKQRVSVAVPAAVAPSATYHPLRSLAHPLEQ